MTYGPTKVGVDLCPTLGGTCSRCLSWPVGCLSLLCWGRCWRGSPPPFTGSNLLPARGKIWRFYTRKHTLSCIFSWSRQQWRSTTSIIAILVHRNTTQPGTILGRGGLRYVLPKQITGGTFPRPPVDKVVVWSRGDHLTKPGWSKPHTHSTPNQSGVIWA